MLGVQEHREVDRQARGSDEVQQHSVAKFMHDELVQRSLNRHFEEVISQSKACEQPHFCTGTAFM